MLDCPLCYSRSIFHLYVLSSGRLFGFIEVRKFKTGRSGARIFSLLTNNSFLSSSSSSLTFSVSASFCLCCVLREPGQRGGLSVGPLIASYSLCQFIAGADPREFERHMGEKTGPALQPVRVVAGVYPAGTGDASAEPSGIVVRRQDD